LAIAQDPAGTGVRSVQLDTDLSRVMTRFAQVSFEELPVADPAAPEVAIAMLQRHDVIAAYSARLLAMRSWPPTAASHCGHVIVARLRRPSATLRVPLHPGAGKRARHPGIP